MLKYFATILLIYATPSFALTAEEGCKVLATHVEVMALAKDYGMPYESAVAWVADLPYVEPWSNMLAMSIEFLYSSETQLPRNQLGVPTFIACVNTLGELRQ